MADESGNSTETEEEILKLADSLGLHPDLIGHGPAYGSHESRLVSVENHIRLLYEKMKTMEDEMAALRAQLEQRTRVDSCVGSAGDSPAHAAGGSPDRSGDSPEYVHH